MGESIYLGEAIIITIIIVRLYIHIFGNPLNDEYNADF